MAWIESHQSLGTHRKLMRLTKLLRIKDIEGVGLLHFLWWWCLDNAPDGNVTDLNAEEIAEAAHWRGESQKFYQALIEAGWLDQNPAGIFLHDWEDFTGKFNEKRHLVREQKRAGGRARMGKLSPDERSELAKQAAEKRWSERDMPAEMPADKKSMPATVPNRTIPTIPTEEKQAKEVVDVFTLYEENIGKLTPLLVEQLKDALKEFGEEKIREAIRETAKGQSKTWRYLEGILKNWRAGNFETSKKTYPPAPAETSEEAERVWSEVLLVLEKQVSAPSFRTYLVGTKGIIERDGAFLIACPNSFMAEYLDTNQHSLLERELTRIRGSPAEIEFCIIPAKVGA